MDWIHTDNTSWTHSTSCGLDSHWQHKLDTFHFLWTEFTLTTQAGHTPLPVDWIHTDNTSYTRSTSCGLNSHRQHKLDTLHFLWTGFILTTQATHIPLHVDWIHTDNTSWSVNFQLCCLLQYWPHYLFIKWSIISTCKAQYSIIWQVGCHSECATGIMKQMD